MANGLVVESSWLIVLLKTTAALLGLILITFGHRLPRLSNGLFWLLATLGLTMFRLARTNYLLAFLAALLLFFALLWLQNRLPRLTMALACLLPLPLFWFGAIYFSGSFNFRPRAAILGALLGAVAGALWPRAMLALLAPFMGIALLAWASPFALSFPLLVVPVLLACAYQFFDLYRRRRRGQWIASPRRTPREVLHDWQKWTAALAGLWLLLALFAPSASAPDPLHGRRLAVLTAPTLEFSPARNFYLTGRARPLALLAPHRSIFNRLTVLLKGRAQGRAIDEQRMVKAEDEIVCMRRAGQVTALAMAQVPALARPGINEQEIQEAILAAFRRYGAPVPSFEPIVGSGANATLPHYDRNDAVLQKGFVVVDIGCMFGGYASDMTRTFPVGGSCTPAQQKLLDLVTAAKAAAETILKPGVIMRQLDDAARQVITRAGFGEYFTHSVGHGVGVDVHDPTPKVLAENMVITLEPGIYIPHGAAVDPAYWDLGVRIEDTYRVTAAGYEILTLPPPAGK
ncbi:MAG: Xaa-Pro peptidase family protein [Candidatus Aminicenantes bacterium]|nr:Xaa-Pro peptidase family protein [Candidatus Aminicenantes bacterium]